MKFRVLKNFSSYAKGEVIELPSSLRVQTLVESRFLLPQDPEVELVSKTPINAIVDENVKVQQKRKSRMSEQS